MHIRKMVNNELKIKSGIISRRAGSQSLCRYKAGEKQVRRFLSPQASRFSPMFPTQANQHFLMRNARFQVFVRYDLESK